MAVTSALIDAGPSSVLVLDGLVAEPGRTAPPGVPVLDGRGARIEGGAVNAHTHVYSGLAPLGMPEPRVPPRRFVEILERVWWRLDRALDRESLAAAAELYVAESLLAGTTTLVDHHESPAFIEGSLDVLADAAQRLGCRLATGFGATERNGGRDEGRRGLAECERFAHAVGAGGQRLVRPLVALHASFTVGDETAREAGDLCRELGVGMHVHLAEDASDVDDARRRGWPGPLERLLELGALPPGSIVAHGVHLSEAQVRAADDAGLWIVQNPRSNAGNQVGYAAALVASAHVALGTDGFPADMRRERAGLAAEAARAAQPLDEAAIARRAQGGHAIASALFGVEIAPTVRAGAAADLVVWDAGGDALEMPARHVLVGGEVVVRDGRLVRGDLDGIRARARSEAARLWPRMQALA